MKKTHTIPPEAGQAIKAARLDAGLTQTKLATSVGITLRQIQRVENGESDPGALAARTLLAIADLLGADPHDFV